MVIKFTVKEASVDDSLGDWVLIGT